MCHHKPFFLQFSGDGTEDISCRLDSSNWLPAESTSGHFSQDESVSFFKKLKIHFIGYLVYPAVFCKNPNFLLQIGNVPPLLDPLVSGDILYDTEFKARD